jgi:hypothetical protein
MKTRVAHYRAGPSYAGTVTDASPLRSPQARLPGAAHYLPAGRGERMGGHG